MPPYLRVAFAAVAAVLAHREWRRVNGDLDRVRKGKAKRSIPTLRRDATTGEWRPSR